MNGPGPTSTRDDLGPSAGDEPSALTHRGGRWAVGIVLGGSILLFALVTTTVESLNAANLSASTWDLGLYQQALWSAAHHGPFYEAADLETGGFGSFLQVHSALVLFALAPLYGAAPTPVLLFAVQGAFVGLAAIPLYGLARSVTGSRRASLGIAVLFLAWSPTLGGTLDQFHIEAFVPVGLFTLAYLLRTGRYLWAIPVAVVAFATMEIVPVFAFFLGLFLLSERWARPTPSTSGPLGVRALWERARATLLTRDALPLWILLAGSVLAYYALLGLRTEYLSAWFGFPAFPASSGHYVIGGDPNALGLSAGNVGLLFAQKLTYWILVLALVGFLPLLAPRTLILIAPWLAFTFLMPITTFVTFGFQYGLLLAGPLFIGVPWGVRALLRIWDAAASGPPPGSARRAWSAGGSRPRFLFAAGAALIAVNLLASPLNPWSGPSGSSAYGLSYAPAPGADGARALAALVPGGASVIASDGLFPLVANDLSAYSLFWHANPNLVLPFGPGHLPSFVFLSQDKLASVPPWLTQVVYNTSDYGVRGVAWGTPLGAAILFELGFNGSATMFGPSPAGSAWIPASAFVRAPSTVLQPDPSARSGEALTTTSGTTGLIWTGPGVDLVPGHYLVVLWVRAFPTVAGSTIALNTNVFSAVGSAFGMPSWYSSHFRYGALDSPTFVPLVFPIHVVAPVLNVQLTGTAVNPDVGIAFAGVQIGALPS